MSMIDSWRDNGLSAGGSCPAKPDRGSLRQAAARRRRRTGHAGPLCMIFTALCLAAASCSGSAATPSAGPAGSLRVRSCYADGRIARCGTLIVPEDRLTGQGRTIPVRFVVIPATGPGRAPDPVVFFAGGPGDSAVGDIPAELPQPMFERFPGMAQLALGHALARCDRDPSCHRAFPRLAADWAALLAGPLALGGPGRAFSLRQADPAGRR